MSIEVAELERPVSGELPEDWREVVLSDVAQVNPETLRASTSPDYVFGYIDISQIEGPGQCAGWTEQTFADAPSRARRKVQTGDILVSTVRPYLRSFAQVPEADMPLVASTGFAVVRAYVDADQQFLYQHILHNSFIEHLAPRMTGSNYPAVSAGDVEAYPILLPPVDEQRRIAEVLQSVDEAIAAAENASTQARCALDGLLLDFFSEARAYTSQTELSPLSNLIVLQSGFAFKSEEYQAQGHFLMRISNVQDGQISLENPKFVRLDHKTQAFELQEGDILTSLTGNIGRVARLTVEHLPAALNQRVARIKPKPDAPIDADYLFFSLKSPLFKSALAEESGGAAQQNVSPKAIGRVEIPLPPLAEQRRIGEMLSAVEDTRVRCDHALEHLRTVKASLMSDLLSGRVRVPA